MCCGPRARSASRAAPPARRVGPECFGPSRVRNDRRRRPGDQHPWQTASTGTQAAGPPTTTSPGSRSTTPRSAAAGATAVAVSMKRSLERMGPKRTAQTLLKLNQADGFDCMTLRLARPRPEEPAHRRVLRERRQGRRRGGHQGPGHPRVLRRALASPSSTPTASCGWASRAASPTRWSSAPAAPTTSPSSGTTPSGSSPTSSTRSTTPTRRRSTPRAAPPTRPRSSTSCSCAPSAPTTCPTARTCATSRPASRWRSRSASARPASSCRTSTTPS